MKNKTGSIVAAAALAGLVTGGNVERRRMLDQQGRNGIQQFDAKARLRRQERLQGIGWLQNRRPRLQGTERMQRPGRLQIHLTEQFDAVAGAGNFIFSRSRPV